MRGFNDVDWTRSGDDADPEAQEETASHELMDAGIVDGRPCDHGAADDQDGSNEHTGAASEGVDGRADEWESGDTTDLVERRNNASPNAIIGTVEEFEKLFVGGQTTKEGAIESVHGLTEKAEQETCCEGEGGGIQELWSLLKQSLVVCLTAL